MIQGQFGAMTAEEPSPGPDGQAIEEGNDPLYDELVSLRVRGLRPGITEELPLSALTEIANAVCPNETEDIERLKCAMRKAADRFEGKYGMALKALWGVDGTYGWPYPDRRKKAMPLLGGKQTSAAFKKNHSKRTAEAFTSQLRALYEESKSAEAASEQPDERPAERTETTAQEAAPFALRMVSAKPLRASLFAVLLLAACYVAASLTIWEGGSSVPAPGTIINATTGQVVTKVVSRTTPQFVELVGELSACDLTDVPPCRYNKRGEPVKVHIGDVVEFSLRLSDPGTQPVPYLEMYVDKSAGLPVPASGKEPSGARVRMRIHWPTRSGEHREGPPETPVVDVIYPQQAKGVHLTYVPGSTVLFDQKGRELAHLPDGIMEAGIALTDMGAPPSCSYCGSEYDRYINFKMQVAGLGQA